MSVKAEYPLVPFSLVPSVAVIYLHHQDVLRVLATVDRILLLVPDAPLGRRDRGLIHYRLGHLVIARQEWH